MKRIALLLAVLALTIASTADAHAQRRFGFVAGGRGGSDSPLLEPEWSLATGYEARNSSLGGFQVGLRSILAYSQFKADAGGYADSLNAEGALEGGGSTVTETGVDGILGVRLGGITGYGFYGFHYIRDRRDAATFTAGSNETEFSGRTVADFGTSRGWGVELDLAGRSGAFAEWYRTRGNDEMVETDGIRFGLNWAL
jgi:hypothetical protein